MYNIAKVAREKVLQCFNALFDGICKLCASPDSDLHSAALILDNILKDIVTETDGFDLDNFLPFLQHQLTSPPRHMKGLVIGWVSVLDSVPDFNMLDHVPMLMPGLFRLLRDPEPGATTAAGGGMGLDYDELRAHTLQVLTSFLRQMCVVPIKNYSNMVHTLVGMGTDDSRLVRFSTLSWLLAFTAMAKHRVVNHFPEILRVMLVCMVRSEMPVELLLTQEQTPGHSHRQLFDVNDDTEWPVGLGPEEERGRALRLNAALIRLAETAPADTPLPHELLLEVLISDVGITCTEAAPRVAALQWVMLLQRRQPLSLHTLMHDLLPPLLRTIGDDVEHVALLSVEVLAFAIGDSQDKFTRVLKELTRTFLEDAQLLERRGAFVVRRLCALRGDGEAIFLCIARELGDILRQYEAVSNGEKQGEQAQCGSRDSLADLETISSFTRILSLLMVTAPELEALRTQVKSALHRPQREGAVAGKSSADAAELFDALYHCWCCNTMATITLCLLSREYYLAFAIISRVGGRDPSVGFLSQGEKLLELLEAPVFLQVRLDLLRCCNAHLHSRQLLKALYGLLMLLTSSPSCQRLSARLKAVATSRIEVVIQKGAQHDFDDYTAISPARMGALLSTFDRVQASMGFDTVV